jgi:hypothetical protein
LEVPYGSKDYLAGVDTIDDGPVAAAVLDPATPERVARAGKLDRLVQTYTRESEHSYLSSAEYAALLQALIGWIETGTRPSPRTIAALCETRATRLEGGCHFDVDYQSPPLSSRQYPREK